MREENRGLEFQKRCEMVLVILQDFPGQDLPIPLDAVDHWESTWPGLNVIQFLIMLAH